VSRNRSTEPFPFGTHPCLKLLSPFARLVPHSLRSAAANQEMSYRASQRAGRWMGVVFLSAASAAGCATPDPVLHSAEGYPAIRFLRTVRASGLFTDVEIGPGTVLVADRMVGGIPFYCGSALMRSFLMRESASVCAFYGNGVFTFSTDRVVSVRIAARSVAVPPGAIQEFRLR
jgi:hypothetical protein